MALGGLVRKLVLLIGLLLIFAWAFSAIGCGGSTRNSGPNPVSSPPGSGGSNPGSGPPGNGGGSGGSGGSGGPGSDGSGGDDLNAAPTKLVYEAASPGDSTILGFRFDASSGAISPLSDSPFFMPGTTFPLYFAGDRRGRFLFVSSTPFRECEGCDYGEYQLMGYAIDRDSGALSAIPGLPLKPDSVSNIALTPNGDYLYALLSGSQGQLTVFSVNQQTGALSRAGHGGSLGDVPKTLAMDPKGRFLFVSSSSTTSTTGSHLMIWVNAVNSDTGKLSATSGSPFDTGVLFGGPTAVNGTGDALFAAGELNSSRPAVAALAISDDGSLQSQPGSPYPASLDAQSISSIAADPLGHFVFVAGLESSGTKYIETFSVQEDGSLKSGATAHPSGHFAAKITVATSGKYVFASAENAPPAVYRINRRDGSLTLLSGEGAGVGEDIIAVP